MELLNGKLTKAKLQPPWAQHWQLPSPLQADGLLLAGHTTVLGAAVLSCSFHNPTGRTMKPAPGRTGGSQRPTPHIWRTEACASRTPIFSNPFPFQAAVTHNRTTLPCSCNIACESTASHPICSPNALSAKLAGEEPPTYRPAINHRKHCAEAFWTSLKEQAYLLCGRSQEDASVLRPRGGPVILRLSPKPSASLLVQIERPPEPPGPHEQKLFHGRRLPHFNVAWAH